MAFTRRGSGLYAGLCGVGGNDMEIAKDAESGIEHYKHMACNMAFICELMKEKAND